MADALKMAITREIFLHLAAERRGNCPGLATKSEHAVCPSATFTEKL